MAGTLDTVVAEIKSIQDKARNEGVTDRPVWPMMILRTPKGWTGPKWWMESKWRERGARTRCRSPSWQPNRSICALSKNG